MLSLLADLLADLRIVTRASLVPTLRASSLLCFNRDWPAKAVDAHAVAAAIAALLEEWDVILQARLELKKGVVLLVSARTMKGFILQLRSLLSLSSNHYWKKGNLVTNETAG